MSVLGVLVSWSVVFGQVLSSGYSGYSLFAYPFNSANSLALSSQCILVRIRSVQSGLQSSGHNFIRLCVYLIAHIHKVKNYDQKRNVQPTNPPQGTRPNLIRTNYMTVIPPSFDSALSQK